MAAKTAALTYISTMIPAGLAAAEWELIVLVGRARRRVAAAGRQDGRGETHPGQTSLGVSSSSGKGGHSVERRY